MDANTAVTSIGFIAWLVAIPATMAFQQFVVYVVFALIGMLFHYYKMKLNKEFNGTLYNYLIKEHPASTFNAVVAVLASGFTYVYSGTVDTITWNALIGLSLSTGYSIDSIVNKAQNK